LIRHELHRTKLQPGDVLLLQGERERLERLEADGVVAGLRSRRWREVAPAFEVRSELLSERVA
jgi:hypothetical protein